MFRFWAVAAVLAAALCFATTGTSRALAGVDASPLAVGAARILIGGGLLGLIALAGRFRAGGWALPSRRDAAVIGVGALGVLAYQPVFFTGTELNGVAVGTVVALGSAPVITGAVVALRLRRPPRTGWLVATGLALLGLVLIAGLAGSVRTASVPGLLASIGAGAAYAAYTLASKELLDRGWAPTATMGAVFGAAAVASLPLLLASPTAWLATPPGLALAGWLGVVTVTVAYLLFGWGLARLSASTVSTLTLAEPLGATVLGLLVLHEQLTWSATLGLVAIAAGLLVLTLPAREVADVSPAA